MTDNNFNGLPMPVFAAFGWAGEEAAIKYALEQLDIFIKRLNQQLPREVQDLLPASGLDEESHAVYLAMESEVDEGGFIVFNTRPTSFEVQVGLKQKEMLADGLKLIGADFVAAHRKITGLGPHWSLRLQQMQIDQESGEALHYQDLFKDTLQALDLDKFQEVFSKAIYLNGEEQWVTPIYLSYRMPAEKAATMGVQIVSVMRDYVMDVVPVLRLISARKPKKRSSRSKRPSNITTATALETQKTAVIEPEPVAPEDGFNYQSTLEPLHVRRGFINLTPNHWPFFSINSRTTTRPVTVYYNGIYDKECSVWRLVQNDQARVVLSPVVHQWLEDTFEAGDKVQVQARLLDEDEIQLTLSPVE